MQIRFIPAASALALAIAVALPASAQEQPANLYIDVATHSMPGMPGMGVFGRLPGAMSGGSASYGMTRHPGMPGKYIDVALHNPGLPGRPAAQAVPRGLGLGSSIDLLPPTQKNSHGDNAGGTGVGLADGNGTFRIRYYWGCGDRAGAGQPREYSVTVRNGKVMETGRGVKPRQVPGNAVTPGPAFALWPNPSTRKTVPMKASLVGQHHVTGDQVPASMQFALGEEHDFLPELKLQGDASGGGMILRWNAVEGARGHFAHATVSDGDTIVMWNSSEDGYAGPELLAYLPEALVAKWVKARTLLGPEARECRIPDAVFAHKGAAPMVQMIAYGNDRSISRDGWTVHVRSKSTAMLMPGAGASMQDAAKPAARNVGKSMLRGLLGR